MADRQRSAGRHFGQRRCSRRSRENGERLFALLANRMFRGRYHGRIAHQRDVRWSGMRQTQELAQRAIAIMAGQFAVRSSRLRMVMVVLVFVPASMSMRVSRLAGISLPRAVGVVVTVTYCQRHSPKEPNRPESDQTAAAKHRAVHASDSTNFTNGTGRRSNTYPSCDCDGAIFRNARFWKDSDTNTTASR